MTPSEIGLYSFGIFFVLFVIYLIYPRNHKQPIRTVVIEKPILQSPEYRCSTKCFDCVRQQSQDHWNVSHGNPHMYGAH